MKPGYHQDLDNQGFQQITKYTPIDPAPDLAIGEDEKLDAQPYQAILDYAIDDQKIPGIEKIKTYDEIQWQGRGEPFSPDDFPSEDFIGNPVDTY